MDTAAIAGLVIAFGAAAAFAGATVLTVVDIVRFRGLPFAARVACVLLVVAFPILGPIAWFVLAPELARRVRAGTLRF